MTNLVMMKLVILALVACCCIADLETKDGCEAALEALVVAEVLETPALGDHTPSSILDALHMRFFMHAESSCEFLQELRDSRGVFKDTRFLADLRPTACPTVVFKDNAYEIGLGDAVILVLLVCFFRTIGGLL